MACSGCRPLILRSKTPLLRCFVRNLKFIESGDVKFKDPPPFDFMGRNFTLFRSFIDPSRPRLNENSKVIVVEGNIGSGKSHLAEKLASYFGMVHFPDATEEDIYRLNRHNPPLDLRVHNYLLPDDAKYYTCEMFWNEPDLIHKGKPLYLQFQFYVQRYWNYLKALCNLFNTGRGFVMDRSPFGEPAFCEALCKCGLLSERALRWFKQIHGTTVMHLWKPHVIVYIKATKEQIREHLKKRNIPWEVNATNLTDKFLDAYTEALERSYISRMDRYSEILPIDGSTIDVYSDDDARVIAQKITELDLVGAHRLRDDYKLLEWRYGLVYDRSIINVRAKFSDAGHSFTRRFRKVNMPMDMMEGRYSWDAHELQYAAMQLDPRTRYPPSFNPRYHSLWNIMFDPFKMKRNFDEDLPKHFLWL